jgi:hypothetical protein
MRNNLTVMAGAVLVAASGIFGFGDPAAADQRQTVTSAAHLMDRGSAPVHKPGRATAILAVGAATPMAAPGVAAPGFAPPGAVLGNLFVPGIDFPTSWYPFWITGAFANIAVFGSTPQFLAVGAAVVSPATPMGIAHINTGLTHQPMSPPIPPPGGAVGGPGLWPGSPMGPLMVTAGRQVLAGAVITSPMMQGIAGLMSPMISRPLFSAFPSPMNPVGTPMIPPGEYIAGAFVSGATVPVELQSFHVE